MKKKVSEIKYYSTIIFITILLNIIVMLQIPTLNLFDIYILKIGIALIAIYLCMILFNYEVKP